MVVKSKLLVRTPDHEKVTLLMVEKAYSVTAAVETDDEIQIVRLDADRAYSLSTSVRVQEIAEYGQPSEHMLPEGHGPGYVWRTFGVTRLEQRDGGVYVEMEMIDLSRGIPWTFRWLIQSLAERLPRNTAGNDAPGHAGCREARDQGILVESPADSAMKAIRYRR